MTQWESKEGGGPQGRIRRGGGGRGGSGTQKFVHQKWPNQIFQTVNSIAFGKSTSQRIYREQHTPKIGWKLHKYRLKHALHSLKCHFGWS